MTDPIPTPPGESNCERALSRLVREAAEERGIALTSLGEGWILRLAKNGVVRHIHGYSFDLNPAATHAIACDKAATSQVLASAGVPRVEHRLFLHPDMARYVVHRGTWEQILAAWRGWGNDVVFKENAGTGGRGVTRCRDVVQLEQAVYRLFTRTESIAVCPFLNIRHEYRFMMLRGRCEVAYEKLRASVTGDGISSVLDLMSRGGNAKGSMAAALLENLDERERAELAGVPGKGEERLLNWRHNLGQGATARVLSSDDPAVREPLAVAKRAAGALGLVFGSVDVVQSRGQTEWSVLEVNSGVMMEFLARSLAGGRDVARRIYGMALSAMFGEG